MKNILLKLITLFITATITISCSSDKQDTTDTSAVEETASTETSTSPFKISLAQWSLHKSFFGPTLDGNWEEFGRKLREEPEALLQGELDPTNFPKIAAGYGVNTIELVNTFYYGKVDDQAYWDAYKQQCEAAGVSVGLIMCDALGELGDADADTRMKAVENHYKWVDIAKFLGAHSIRVNAAGKGTAEEVAANAVDGLSKLGEYAATKGINILVENHGGYSSDGTWLAGVMQKVGKDNVGTLPDFGNFCIERTADGCANEYDRYQGMADLMPFAKGVSAKAHEFDDAGNEVHSDFLKIMKIVKDSGFEGYVGIEFEGGTISEDEGIKATKALLEKVFAQI